MKLLVVFAAFVAVCVGNAIPDIPQVPGDNSHYVEGESRYIWMPDGEGVPHLVDLEEPVDQEVVRNRNGANNLYWLFTRQNPTSAQVITHNNANSVSNSNYLGSRQLKVIVHGWNGNGNNAMNNNIRNAFLAIADVNVIVVDWRQLASANYLSAAAGVPGVGTFLGNFLVWLINTGGGNWNNVHLIGFSLGAHVVGSAGRQAGGRPGRVTGLDPAGPGWTSSSNRLMPANGVYVEGIHTDGGLLGIMNACGHADFYPNGGRNPQPGCSNSNCSHGRAPSFMEATIRFNHLVGRRCTNMTQAQSNSCTGVTLNMGNGIVTKRGVGLHGLSTGSSFPF